MDSHADRGRVESFDLSDPGSGTVCVGRAKLWSGPSTLPAAPQMVSYAPSQRRAEGGASPSGSRAWEGHRLSWGPKAANGCGLAEVVTPWPEYLPWGTRGTEVSPEALVQGAHAAACNSSHSPGRRLEPLCQSPRQNHGLQLTRTIREPVYQALLSNKTKGASACQPWRHRPGSAERGWH